MGKSQFRLAGQRSFLFSSLFSFLFFSLFFSPLFSSFLLRNFFSNYITISTLILDATRSSTVNTAGQANIITAANFIRILNNEIINGVQGREKEGDGERDGEERESGRGGCLIIFVSGHTASGITFNGNNSVIDSNIIHNVCNSSSLFTFFFCFSQLRCSEKLIS